MNMIDKPNTIDKPTTWMKTTGGRIGGVGSLIKGVAILIGSIGLLLVTLHEFPNWTESPSQPSSVGQQKSVETTNAGIAPIENVGIKRIPIDKVDREVATPGVLNVGGTWHDDQNNALNLEQDGSTVHVNMAGNSDGFAYELIGSGVLTDQSVHLELDCRSFGQSVGQMPADITFINSRKAILSMTFMGVPVSGTIHR